MLNTALQVLSKDGTIADNTYQLVGEDGVLPQGDVKGLKMWTLRYSQINLS